MRLIISYEDKKELLKKIKQENNCKNLNELSEKIKISKKTLDSWFYLKKSTLPYEYFRHYLDKNIKIIDKKEDNWGQIQGGKRSQDKIIKKYGKDALKEFWSLGGKRGAQTKDNIAKKSFSVDLENPIFLEIYGALLGDGWLNNTKNKESRWGIGLCGNLKLDNEYIKYCRGNINQLINRKGYVSEKEKGNVIEFRFRHKWFFKLLNEKLNFPAGKKKNLAIPDSIYCLDYNKTRYLIRGIFDTDGSFYLSKDKKGVASYPHISIHINQPILIEQIALLLKNQGFKIVFERANNQIKLNGTNQLRKWIKEIGSSNPTKISKMQNFLDSLSNISA